MFFSVFMIFAAKSVTISGNNRISKDVIASRIAPEAFDNDEAFNDAYKNVVDTGFFKNVVFEKDQGKIAVKVTENSTINQIAFEGNKKLKDDQLTEIIKKFNLMSRRPFPANKTLLAPVVQAIKEVYRQASVPVEVSVSTIPLTDNRVNVIFNINEEPKMRIRSIEFQGLKNISERALRNVMYTKKYNPVKFLTQDHYFLLERVEHDNRLILEYIRNCGYPNAKVHHTYAQLDPDTQNYRLIFYIEEGDKYKIGNVDFEVDRQDLPMDKVKSKNEVKTGQTYNQKRLRNSIFSIQEVLSQRGFNTLDFDIAEKQNTKDKTVDIVFKIKKGRNITIRRIHIMGNTRTRHDVILDRMKLREGDRFNQIKLIESQKNLESTGFFKEVNVQPAQIDMHTVDLAVKVTEARTGAINFALSLNSLQGVSASIGFADANIKGSGLTLNTGVSIGKKEQNIQFGISNPRFLRRDIRGGFNLMYSKTDLFEDRIEKTVGGELSVAYDLSPWIRQDLSIGARYESSKPNPKSDPNYQGIEVKELNSVLNQAQGDEKRIAELKRLFKLDEKEPLVSIENLQIMKYKLERRDRITKLLGDRDFGDHSVTEFSHGLSIRPPIFPTGYSGVLTLRMDNVFAGLLGDVSFLKNTVTASYHHRVGEYLNFVSQFTYGRISKIGSKNLRITDCKVMGGQDFHGFDFSGIGPRDVVSGLNVGGKEFYLGKLEANVPLPFVSQDLGIRIGAYTEFGSSHNSKFGTDMNNGTACSSRLEIVNNYIYDQHFCRVSIGMYVKLVTPFGPLRFDFAKPLRMMQDKQGRTLDEERRFMVGYAYQL